MNYLQYNYWLVQRNNLLTKHLFSSNKQTARNGTIPNNYSNGVKQVNVSQYNIIYCEPVEKTSQIYRRMNRARYPIITFCIIVCMALVKKAISQTTISLTIAKQTAYFTQGTDTVLCYQIAPPKTDSAHWRPHYVHPLYLPDGTMLTEDYPQDHPHHHGIFWAWHQLFVGEKTLGDAWDIRQFNWQVTQVTADTAKGLAKTLNSHVLWSSPLLPDSAGKPIPLVREQTSITVYPSVQNYRIVDFKICLQALLPDVRIGGSANDKGYGGFSARMRMAEHMQFIGTDGDVVPLKLPITAGPWLDISGPIGRNDSIAGLCIMAHSNNPGHPNPWILRTQRSMQNAVYPHPGATPIPLPNDSSTTLRYRLVLHQGLLTTAQLNALYANFAKHR